MLAINLKTQPHKANPRREGKEGENSGRQKREREIHASVTHAK